VNVGESAEIAGPQHDSGHFMSTNTHQRCTLHLVQNTQIIIS
jgi:hypothetical protein